MNRQLLWATATITTQTTTALVAAVASKRINVCKLIVSIYAFADTGTIALADSAATYWKTLAKDDNGGSYELDFGEHGLPLTAGSACNIVTATANTSSVVTIGYWVSL